MNIVFFTHPSFFNSRSMRQFSRMLSEGMLKRGHQVTVLEPQAFLSRLPLSTKGKKWLGYFDQYIIFPLKVKSFLRSCTPDTLFVFTDQALAPWVKMVKDRPFVLHCHDFMALKSALGRYPENPVSWSGRRYQAFIKNGFTKGKYFISVSRKTQLDLHDFLLKTPLISEVLYNQIACVFEKRDKITAREEVAETFKAQIKSGSLNPGYLLHVGVNVWYKNKRGVLEIYDAWRRNPSNNLPLVMVGDLGEALESWVQNKPWRKDLLVLHNLAENTLINAYAGASVFIFPSLDEGFGWPIAEAMACGCPVITTNQAPMTEVGGNAAFYIPRRPVESSKIDHWAQKGAELLHKVVSLSPTESEKVVEAGLQNIARFKSFEILDKTEAIYKKILKEN